MIDTPYEYIDKKLGVKVNYLTSDRKPHAKSLKLITYRALKWRMDSKTCTEEQLRSGSWGHCALIAFDSLCAEWKHMLHLEFKDPEQEVKKSFFASRYVTDAKAWEFFENYRYGDDNNKKLPPEVIELYVDNASVLNTCIKVKAERKNYARAIGGVKLDIWKSLSNDVNGFTEVEHDLPTTPGSLRYKLSQYVKNEYESLISKHYGNQRAAKVASEDQSVVIEELLNKHQNLNNEQIANLYNLTAKIMRWKPISSATVANERKKRELYTYAGRRGTTNFMHNIEMQVKRKGPSAPLFYWTLDGWDAELMYQKTTINKNGHKVTSYHHRLVAVVVLDPYNYYPVGYAIGDSESPALIREAVRNAINHTRELFGTRYKPQQLQSDRYQIKNLRPFFEQNTKHFTPAKVKNSKSKVIEQYFDKLNEKHFQAKLLPNWSGHNVNSLKSNQPNADYLDKIKHQFPDRAGCFAQIKQAIECERREKRAAFIAAFINLADEDKIVLTTESYLRQYGVHTGFTNRLTGNGVTPTIEGEIYYYDSFDINFRKHRSENWLLLHDPDDMNEVLAVNANSRDGRLEEVLDTVGFMLTLKHIQPMALRDRSEGDSGELAKVAHFNKELRETVKDRHAERHEVLTELFSRNPELEMVQKMVLPNSVGQHKDVKAQLSGKMPTPPSLPPRSIDDDYDEIIDDVRNDY